MRCSGVALGWKAVVHFAAALVFLQKSAFSVFCPSPKAATVVGWRERTTEAHTGF